MHRRRGADFRMAAAPAPQRSRLAEFFGSVPLLTLSLIVLCVVIYVADNLGEPRRTSAAPSR